MALLVSCVRWLACTLILTCHLNRYACVLAEFSTKEVYPSDLASTSSLELNDDNCVALRLDLVARHGTRYPSSSTFRDISDLERTLLSLKPFLPSSGPLSWMATWTNPFTVGESGQLAPRGQMEHYHMSKRYFRRLPVLIGNEYYSPVNFTFMSTGKPRCLQSASSFAFGLFEGSGMLGKSHFQPTAVFSKDLEHDPLLRFYDMCPLYKQTKTSPQATVESRKFLDGPEMERVTQRVNSLLGLPMNHRLLPVDVLSMYKIYAFESSTLNLTRFSTLFTAEDKEVLEYAMDMAKYYKNGYGFAINWQISCTLMDDILDNMEDAIKAAVGRLDDGKPRAPEARAVLRFAHAETLIPLLCYMGMFHDAEPLRADNFERQRKRLFRGADLAPFAGNLAFVLYQCPQSGRVDPNADVFPHFSVKLLLHEREVPIPGCMAAPDGSCRFDRLRALFPTKACDLKKMCRKSSMADIRSSNENDRSAFDNREAELTERGRRFEQGGDQLHRGASRQFHREYDDDDDHDDDDDDDYDDDDDDDDWKRRHFRHRRTSHDNRKFRQNRRFEL